MRQAPATDAGTTHRVARLAMLVLALAFPAACDDDPFPGCPGEARLPAFCGSEPDELCQCNTCDLAESGEARCNLSLVQSQASCRADGSEWATCGCSTGPSRAECAAACETMRCTEACDDRSVVSCQQRCQDFFDQHQARRDAPPSEGCAVAIATIALCMPDWGCPQAPPCAGVADWDPQRDLYVSECAADP